MQEKQEFDTILKNCPGASWLQEDGLFSALFIYFFFCLAFFVFYF